MILSDRSIRRELANGVIEVAPPVSVEQIRPTGIRVHLGDEFLVPRPEFTVDLQGSRSLKFDRVKPDENGFVLQSGGFILGSTREVVRVRSDLICHLDGRSTLARLGLFIHCGSAVVDNNNGQGRSIVLELANAGPFSLRLHPGIAIGLLTFSSLSESIEQSDQRQYEGQLSVEAPDLSFHARRGLHIGLYAPRMGLQAEQSNDVETLEVPSHAPSRYDCPFCTIAAGDSTPATTQDDVVYHDDAVTAFIASEWWPNNPGAVLVITNTHLENLYEVPDRLGSQIYRASRLVALAMKDAYGCAGTSTRQHNEPAGGQDVWHYHQHVFPRYPDDHLYQLTEQRAPAPLDQKARYARALRAAILKLTGECRPG